MLLEGKIVEGKEVSRVEEVELGADNQISHLYPTNPRHVMTLDTFGWTGRNGSIGVHLYLYGARNEGCEVLN